MKNTSSDNAVKLQTKEQFKAEIARWAAVMKVKPAQIRVQRMTKKWASCSSKSRVSFSADLLREPKPFQDYVIVHELLHLQVPNHGKLFKSLMNAYLPGWENTLTDRNGSAARSLCIQQFLGQ
ncbi:MAG: M48 family metallopeptidase [Deltaproteobacteria bacterium]|nr:M48 family metallopeptidase [Deltaproteobacteria bacterium]